MNSIEICAGAGGQALGLEQAGFDHLALVEIDDMACVTLRYNRPDWNVIEGDVHDFSASRYPDVDLLAGGVPCPPFSVAGKQLGGDDERDLFPEAIRLVAECRPRAVMLENVRGFLAPKFEGYRAILRDQLEALGFHVEWRLLQAADYGVSQLRPRVVIVALRRDIWPHFSWPSPGGTPSPTVGELLLDQMAENGWTGAGTWSRQANAIAPTLVGGSKKHGGPDLGPTRAKRAWRELGVNGGGVADAPPGPDFEGLPKLTVPMVARLQGFPDDWTFSGRKTAAYRQVGNAFPPPVARAVGEKIRLALLQADSKKKCVA